MNIRSARILDKHSQAGKLYFTDDDIRFATPELVAEYRAKRLSCNIIVDIGCSIGFQTLAFAQHCKHVISIERDAQKIKKAQENAKALGLTNITFICGDALDPAVVAQVKHADIYFCDPHRPPEETSRKLESIEPNITELIKTYLPLKNALAIEFPPQLRDLPFDAEREYISVHGLVNRLTLYFGVLKKSDASAVVLPEEKVIRSVAGGVKREASSEGLVASGEKLDATSHKQPATSSFIYEVDGAVVSAGLTEQLLNNTKTTLLGRQKFTFVTGSTPIKSPFFRNAYRVLATSTEEKLQRELHNVGARVVKIRFSIDPKQYDKKKKELEKELRGSKSVSVLKFGEEFVVVEDAKNQSLSDRK